MAPVTAVHRISTGSGEQHAEHRRGSALPRLWWALTSRSWIKIPINVYVIEHRAGLVLFDTGLNPAISSDPHYISSAIGRLFLKRLFRLHIGPEDGLGRQLATRGFDAADVRTAVISHLHFDHVGGISELPNAELLVSAKEWDRLSGSQPERDWILREHIEIPGMKWRPIEFEPMDDPLVALFGGGYDVAGDGSMILLPTPGHTPGSMSMLVRSSGLPPILLIGDLTYETELLMKDTVPGVGEPAQLRASFAKVRALKERLPGLVILAAHEPGLDSTIRPHGVSSQ